MLWTTYYYAGLPGAGVHYSDSSSISAVVSSAGRSPWFYLSMFVSDVCDQASNIYDCGVKSVNQTEKSNIK